MDIIGLIARAPWREAMTYRDSWPHEYVMVKKDGQEALLAAFCARIEAGEGVECEFFNQRRGYLFDSERVYSVACALSGEARRWSCTMTVSVRERPNTSGA